MKKMFIVVIWISSLYSMEAMLSKGRGFIPAMPQPKTAVKAITELNYTNQELRDLSRLQDVENKLAIVSIDLSGNLLTTIAANAFEGFDNLEFIKLSNNRIVTVDKDAFKGLLYLREIFITNNQITELNDELFDCFDLPTVVSKIQEED